MQQVKLEAQKREESGKGAARGMRRAGNLPGVLYGRKNEVIPIQIDARGFQDFLHNYGENAFINLEIVDHGTENVMVKEVQRDPVSNQVLHTDLLRISMDEPITSAVPITLIGSAPGIQEGGILEFPHRQLTLHCLPTLLPEEIEVDISGLDIDDRLSVNDVSLPEDIEIIDDPNTRIVAVVPPRIEEEPEEEEGLEEEAAIDEDAEPEVISRRSDDDEEDEE
ncbi:50S ribosomal protein L25 [Candidatus Poribacteria bacterium]|nr:50S ribosomal protein L25 [Candidatus Poribacteria bacterium]